MLEEFCYERFTMKWTVNMKVKDYVRNWSNQDIHTEYARVTVDIKIKGNYSEPNVI